MDRDTAKEIILASLPNYLAQKGVNFSGGRKFTCLNPDHQDHSPSMHETNAIVSHADVMLTFLT